MKRRATRQGGRRTATSDNADDGDATQPSVADQQDANATASPTPPTRGMARVSNDRAAYFARGDAPPPSQRRRTANTTTTASTQAAPAAQPPRQQSSWPGYYATAYDLGEQRQAAQAAREQELQRNATGSDATENKVVWEPRRKPRTTIRTQNSVIPRLQDLALLCVARHIEVMPTLEYIDASARHDVAKTVVKLRRMKPEVLPLFIFPGVTEIDIPDCSMLDETSFLDALQACTTSNEALVLTILRLGLCGRCVSDSVITELGNALRTVEQLALQGCYRLSDAGMEALVRRCAPSLRDFALSCNQRITKTSLEYVGELQHLVSLSLSECPQLDDTALSPLFKIQSLRQLELNQMEHITDEFVGELTRHLPDLEDLSLARCSQLSDVSIRAALENCRNLRAIDLSDLFELTDDSLEPIRRLGHALRHVTIRRCLGLTDIAIEHVAIGANKYLERLEISSVAEVTDASLQALQTHSLTNLHVLDISFCRNLTEDCLGVLTDHAEALISLTLWGCTQITARFLTCHARDELIITGHPLLTGLTIKY